MKLKASERRLLVVFLGLFAVIVGGFGTTLAVRHFGGSVGEVRALAERRDALVEMLGESEHWGARSAWIEQRIPSFASREDASTQLLDMVSQTAESAGIEIRNRKLLNDPNATPSSGPGAAASDSAGGVYFDRVAVTLELAGAEEGVLKWLHGIQQPDLFMGVTHLTYVPTDSGVRCSARVSLWFREFPNPSLAKSP